MRPYHNGARPWAWNALGVAILAVGVTYGLITFRHGLPAEVYRVMRPAHHPAPVAPTRSAPPPVALITTASAPRHHVSLIRGTRLLSYGGKLELSGHSVSMPGTVRVLGRWNSGRWVTFAVANANGRSYRFAFPLPRRGTLQLKIVQPDGSTSVGTYQVS